MKGFLLMLALLTPVLASAEVWRCTDSAGHVVFQATPCPDGTNTGISTQSEAVIPYAPPSESGKIDGRHEEHRFSPGSSGSPGRFHSSGPAYTGPRGGRFHYSESGGKVYERRE